MVTPSEHTTDSSRQRPSHRGTLDTRPVIMLISLSGPRSPVSTASFCDITILFRSGTLTRPTQHAFPLEQAPLRYLDSMSLLSTHPAAVFYPQPNLGFGPSVVSRKRWSQIRHLTMSPKLPNSRSNPILSLGSRAIPRTTEVTLFVAGGVHECDHGGIPDSILHYGPSGFAS